MSPQVEIFSQGEEVVTGQTVDTNAAWLARKLVDKGFVVRRHTAVGDNLPDLQSLLTEISQRADCCICTGGLGPTVDDLTAQAVADAFNLPLQLDSVALTQIAHFFTQRKRVMADSNRKQAYFPLGAERIDNEWGTAPGFSVQSGRCWFVFLPGVPTEMKSMFEQKIAPILAQRFVLQPTQLITLRSVGIGESDLQQKLNNILLPDKVQLSFRAAADEVQTKLLFPATMAQQQLEKTIDQVLSSLGDYVFAVDSPRQPQSSLVDVIDHLMQQRQFIVSVEETATQGLIAAKCIARPWLKRSAFCQSTEQNIPLPSAEHYFTRAEQRAETIRQDVDRELVLVQLYQGTAQQFQQKEQNISVYNLLLTPEGCLRSEFILGGPATRKQNQAAILALDLLRRYL